MKTSVILLLVLALGAFVAQFLMKDAGYVLIDFQGYTIEMSVPAVVLLLAFVYVAIRLVVRVLRAPRKLGQAAGRVSQRRSAKNFQRGLVEIAEGNWSRGERMLTRGIRHNETPLLNYLAAARAAQQQGAYERRDRWLEMAREQSPDTTAPVLMTQAELQLEQGQYRQALATLDQLQGKQANAPQALDLRYRIYRATSDWDGMRRLLPRLKKVRKRDAEVNETERKLFAGLLEKARDEQDSDAIDALWSEVPKGLRSDEVLLLPYLSGLVAAGRLGLEPQLRKLIHKTWNADFVELYGRLETPAAKRIKRVEDWLRERSDDAALLRLAGELCIKEKLWGKARSYLESSIAIDARPSSYQIYGQLLEELGESVAASAAFRKGLNLVSPVDLPALEKPANNDA